MKHPLIEPLESRIAPASTLSITSAVTLKEGNAGETAFVFTVTLSEAPTATVSVDYATADVTATAGSDYTARSGTLNFQPGGALTRTISVPVTGDTVGEDDETFTVTLSGATTGTTITNAVGIGTIENDAVLTLSELQRARRQHELAGHRLAAAGGDFFCAGHDQRHHRRCGAGRHDAGARRVVRSATHPGRGRVGGE
jgi:hypothetical protein